MHPEIDPQEANELLKTQPDVFLLDVREPFEFEIANLGGHLIPLSELPNRLKELDPQKRIIVYCHHGGRSAQAVDLLISNGFPTVYNLAGGIDRWSLEVDSSIPRY